MKEPDLVASFLLFPSEASNKAENTAPVIVVVLMVLGRDVHHAETCKNASIARELSFQMSLSRRSTGNE